MSRATFRSLWRRPLARLRGRFTRAGNAPDLPGRYYRALLFGGGATVTLALLAAVATGVEHLFERYLDERQHLFLVQRDLVKASVEDSQASLKQTVEAYEILRNLHDDTVPVDRYRQLLAQNRGVVATGEDVTASPFSLLSSLMRPADDARLARLLRFIREISPSPLLRLRDAGYYLGGFTYTEDHSFFATWPPLPDSTLATARASGIGPLIARYTAKVDAQLNQYPEDALRRQRVFWVALYDSEMYGTLVTHYAAPIYRGGQRVAVMVVTIPFAQFPQIFQSIHREPDFFVVSRDRKHFFGLGETNPRAAKWTRTVLSNPGVFERADARIQIVRIGGSFFVIQRIPGPNWIAVYAFDWRTIAADLGGQLLLMGGLTLAVLAVLWGFIVLLERFVLAPLRSRARQVYESEAFNRTVLATAPVGLTVFDPSANRIVIQNEIAQKLLAASPDEAGFYRRLLEARSGKRRIARATRARAGDAADGSATANGVSVAEASVATASGGRREISAAFSRARYQQREVVLFGLTDISRQKATVRFLQRARQAADEANRAKSMFVATMSHEIRTPLHGALGNLELLSMDGLTLLQQERVSVVRRAFDTLLALVNDVLDLSKAQAQQLQLHIEPFRLDEVLERCAQTFAPVITGKGLRFLCLIDPRLAGSWRGDAHRITQILMNLLGNARKFTQAGSITMRATLGCSADARAWVRLSVADSGIGIPPARQERIFEPFAQADRSIASRFGGTGLGLSLCRRLADLMGGKIAVESVEGEGTLFTVDLPLQRDVEGVDAPLALANYAFDTIVVACDRPAWQDVTLARMRGWFPDARVIGGAPDTAMEPGEHGRAIVAFGCHDNAVPSAWDDAHQAYVDTVLMSEQGPLYPERRGDAIHVTAFSAAMLKLALAACGEPGDAFAGSARSAPLPAAAEHRAARILVAEDDPLNRTLLGEQLATLGYEHVDSVTDGSEALTHCLRDAYDLVVTDLGMAAMDGRELLTALRQNGIATPVILNTAGSGDGRRAKSEGFAEVLRKPVAIERLRIALEQVLGKSAPRAGAPPSVARANPRLQAVFLAAWPEDEAALREAVANVDGDAFLRRMHRVKGALLVLKEREAIGLCKTLCERAEAHGMAEIHKRMAPFWEAMAQIVERYRCSAQGVS
jgi:two-component system, NarL family, capsular synthesis sensor histidine kinase RcsC